MNKKTLVLAVFFLVAVSGCSNKEIYDGIIV
ncbi:MAG: outer membrane lipoprotein SlyB [Halioglobus sp.]|jgi:outer membrane lipoprotein SlyB